MVKIVCPQCGTVSSIIEGSNSDDGNWLECSVPQGFEWKLPSGKITPVVGDPIYVSATGEQLSRQAYINKYGIDPQIAYERMRGKK